MGWHAPGADHRAHAALRRRVLGDPGVRRERAAVRASSGCSCAASSTACRASPRPAITGEAALVCLTVIVARIVSVPVFTYLPRWAFRSVREADPYPPWRWLGAAVLGRHPRSRLAGGGAGPAHRLPDRQLIIFLTFSVIVATLGAAGADAARPDPAAGCQRRRRRRAGGRQAASRAARRRSHGWRNCVGRAVSHPQDRRAPARVAGLPPRPLPGPPRRRRRRRHRAAIAGLPAGHARAAGRRASRAVCTSKRPRDRSTT